MTLAEAAAHLLKEEGRSTISRNYYGLLDEAYALCDSPRKKLWHPLARHRAVMQAVARSKLFERDGRILMDIGQGLGERYYPNFKLKETQ